MIPPLPLHEVIKTIVQLVLHDLGLFFYLADLPDDISCFPFAGHGHR